MGRERCEVAWDASADVDVGVDVDMGVEVKVDVKAETVRERRDAHQRG